MQASFANKYYECAQVHGPEASNLEDIDLPAVGVKEALLGPRLGMPLADVPEALELMGQGEALDAAARPEP